MAILKNPLEILVKRPYTVKKLHLICFYCANQHLFIQLDFVKSDKRAGDRHFFEVESDSQNVSTEGTPYLWFNVVFEFLHIEQVSNFRCGFELF